MKELITKFEETGDCEVDIDKVCKAWSNRFCISQYHQRYTLIKQYSRKGGCAKVQISPTQAMEIIRRHSLLAIHSSLFSFAKTYRTQSNIVSERTRIQKIYDKKQAELGVLGSILHEFNQALKQQTA